MPWHLWVGRRVDDASKEIVKAIPIWLENCFFMGLADLAKPTDQRVSVTDLLGFVPQPNLRRILAQSHSCPHKPRVNDCGSGAVHRDRVREDNCASDRAAGSDAPTKRIFPRRPCPILPIAASIGALWCQEGLYMPVRNSFFASQ